MFEHVFVFFIFYFYFCVSMEINNFEEIIKPFIWIQHETYYSVILNIDGYKQDIFDLRADEGFEGGGYDWASLATVFIQELHPELENIVQFDPEGSLFSAFSNDEKALQTFIIKFKEALDNDNLIKDLFSRAELD